MAIDWKELDILTRDLINLDGDGWKEWKAFNAVAQPPRFGQVLPFRSCKLGPNSTKARSKMIAFVTFRRKSDANTLHETNK